MALSNNLSRLLIVNGQPILIKDDVEFNSVQSFSSGSLQQAIDVTSADQPLSPVMRSNDIVTSEQNKNVGESSRSEYVAVLSNDENIEVASTIRLTLEQAAELGLHFTVETIDHNLQTSNKDIDTKLSNHNQHVLPIKTSDQPNTTNCIKSNSESDNLGHGDDLLTKLKGNDNGFYFNSINSTQNQGLTLVPHILNGTVTYTIELSNHNNSLQSNDDFLKIKDSSVISESPDKEVKLNFANLSTSELSYINSPVDVVSNKPANSIDRISSEQNISNQSYGLVSCNSENVTFLSLSDTLAIGTSISNTVTQARPNSNTTQRSKLFNVPSACHPVQYVTKQRIEGQGGESLLLKRKNLVSSQNRISNKPSCSQHVKSTGKVRVIKTLSSNCSTSGLSSKLINNDNSSSELSVCITKTGENEQPHEFLSTRTINSEILDKEDSLRPINEFMTLDSTCLVGNSKTAIHSPNKIEGQPPTIIIPKSGDVPKEISAALSRIPIKTDCNKPLGSNENPIQLVQQGSTFHSMQALTEDHILKIKPILQEKFDTKLSSKNVVYDPASNTRIIYRIISPEEVSLRKKDEFPRRRGRPKKVRSTDSQPEEGVEGAPPPKKMFPRTRSGRLSRPPKHMVRDYKHIRRYELDDSDGGYSDYQSEHEEDLAPPPASAPVELLPGLVTKRKCHKRNISAGNLCPTCGKIYLGYVRMKRHFDKYPDHGSIEYLDTIRSSHPDSEGENHKLDGGNGLWKKGCGRRKGKVKNNCFTTSDKRTRLKEVLEWCQNKEIVEIAGPAVASVLSLWELLLLRVDSVKQDSRVATMYHELQQLLCKLRQLAHRLFRPLNHPLPAGTKHVTVQVEDDIMTGLLNLPQGVYLASDEDLNETTSADVLNLPIQEPQVTPPSLPLLKEKAKEKFIHLSKSKLDLDEEPQSFLLSNEEMICDSDDRGLVNVDEIVSERLQNFTGSQSSSVDELMKGLNELEQRNKLDTDDLMEGFSIGSRRTHVSASTEDLMKSLENFDSDLNHSTAPSTLERDTFDRVSNVDTLDFEVLSREFHSNNR